MIAEAKQVWESGLGNEVDHWANWLSGGAEAFAHLPFNDYSWRRDPKADLRNQPHIADFLTPISPAVSPLRLLDVGAGPLTVVGKNLPGRQVQITAVDPLAPEYDKLLAHNQVVPLVRTTFAEVERLTDQFVENSFDFVYCQNALDHVYDPIKGIDEMLRVVKPGHTVVLFHRINEGENEKYWGLHQWNFCREGGQFIIWGTVGRYSVNKEFVGKATVSFLRPCRQLDYRGADQAAAVAGGEG